MAVKTGTVTLPWGDGEYPFRLGIGEIQEIERKCSCRNDENGQPIRTGFIEIYDRLCNRTWMARWPGEIIRNGLIGGGMLPKDVVPLIKRYVDERPLMDNLPIAHALMLSALLPPVGEESKKSEAEEKQNGASPSADFTKTAPVSDSAPAM